VIVVSFSIFLKTVGMSTDNGVLKLLEICCAGAPRETTVSGAKALEKMSDNDFMMNTKDSLRQQIGKSKRRVFLSY